MTDITLFAALRAQILLRGLSDMNLSGPVITELARTWTLLHGDAAEAHLNQMAIKLQRAGDLESAATFRCILDRVRAARVELAEHPA